jgi:hypothetical protein
VAPQRREDRLSRELLELQIQRGKGLFEHPAMRGCSGALQIALSPRAGQLQGSPVLLRHTLFWRQRVSGIRLPSSGLFLLGFD